MIENHCLKLIKMGSSLCTLKYTKANYNYLLNRNTTRSDATQCDFAAYCFVIMVWLTNLSVMMICIGSPRKRANLIRITAYLSAMHRAKRRILYYEFVLCCVSAKWVGTSKVSICDRNLLSMKLVRKVNK